jgi:hypothetical protein
MTGGGRMVGVPALAGGRPDMAGAAKFRHTSAGRPPPAEVMVVHSGGVASLTCPADGRSAAGWLARQCWQTDMTGDRAWTTMAGHDLCRPALADMSGEEDGRRQDGWRASAGGRTCARHPPADHPQKLDPD